MLGVSSSSESPSVFIGWQELLPPHLLKLPRPRGRDLSLIFRGLSNQIVFRGIQCFLKMVL